MMGRARPRPEDRRSTGQQGCSAEAGISGVAGAYAGPMLDSSPKTPDPTPDTPPVAFERGSGRHRADTVQMRAVPAAPSDREPSRGDAADPGTGGD